MRINYLTEKIFESDLRMSMYAENLNAYYEHLKIGRYSIHALLYKDDGHIKMFTRSVHPYHSSGHFFGYQSHSLKFFENFHFGFPNTQIF